MMQFCSIMPNFYQTFTPMFNWSFPVFNWSFQSFNWSMPTFFNYSMPTTNWNTPSYSIFNNVSNPFAFSSTTTNYNTNYTFNNPFASISSTTTNYTFNNPFASTQSTGASIFSFTPATTKSTLNTFSYSTTNTANLVRGNGSAKSIMQNAARLAKSQEGVRETSRNDSIQIRKYKNGAVNSRPWCGSFVSWCYGSGQGRTNKETFGYNANSQSIKRKADSYFHSGGYRPQVGDLAIWSGHIGIVTAINGNKVSITQGNTSDRVQTISYNLNRIPNNGGSFCGFVDMESWLSKNGTSLA